MMTNISSWTKVQLKDIAELKYGKSPKGIKVENALYPIYGTSGINGFTEKPLFYGPLILIGRKGTINKPIYIEKDCWITDTAFGLIINEDKADLKWLYYFLVNYKLERLNEATGVPSLSRGNLEPIVLSLPSKNEQNKIAAILTSVDDVIEKTEVIIKQTEKVKKGLMQQLLTKGIGHTNFKQTEIGEVPEEWEYAPLKNYCENITYGFTNPMPTTESGPFMVTAKDIKKGIIQYETARRTDVKKFNSALSPKSKPVLKDLLITKDGTLGRMAIVDKENICINQSVASIRLYHEVVDVNFIYYLLLSPRMQQRILLDAGGSTIKHIYITKLGEMKVPLPKSKIEQQNIINILSSCDQKLLKEQKKLIQLNKLKKGLMQVLLTGKVRVKVDEWEAVK